MLATLMLQRLQLYKEQLRKKHVSFHKGIHPDVKRMLLAWVCQRQSAEKTKESNTCMYHQSRKKGCLYWRRA